MSINSVMISRILPQYTAEYIANVFWNHNIAQVSSITLLPYLQGSTVFHTAYVSIATWADSEVAYNLIQRLKDDSKKARIVHKDDLWWPMKINTHNTGNIYLGPYTTTFPESYFNRQEPEEEETEERVISTYKFDGKLTVNEAIARCGELSEAIEDISNFSQRPSSRDVYDMSDFCEEIDFLEQQLRNYGNQRMKSDEKLIKYYGIPEQYMTVKDANRRLDFLKTIVPRYSPKDHMELLTVNEIKDEIEFIEDQLFSIITLQSQNVTLRPHQQSFTV
jgi:hypothetical protein